MSAKFVNTSLKDLRKIYTVLGPTKIVQFCNDKAIPPPERPSDLIFEYTDNRFYLCRVLQGGAMPIYEIDDDFFDINIPAEGWTLKKYKNTKNTK